MNIKINTINEVSIAEIVTSQVEINNEQDALNLFANAIYQGSNRIVIGKGNLIEEIFDLKTGIAGAIFQKCSNYNVKLAIVGDFSQYNSKSLRDFIRESNKYGQINFVSSTEEAYQVLSKN